MLWLFPFCIVHNLCVSPVCESKILIFSFIELTSVSRLHFYGRYHHSKTISSCKVSLRGYEPQYETTLNKYGGGIFATTLKMG